MAIPSTKSEGVEKGIKALLGADRRDAILADRCQPKPIGCGAQIVGFRDELSAKEYTISGLCQKCQDSVFGGKPKRAPKGKATKNLIVPAPKKTGLQKDGTFFVGGHLPMKSGAFEASKFVYKKVTDRNGNVWLYPANSPAPAEQVHVHNPKDLNSQGYGGATLQFVLEDGTVYSARGPWHGNADALFAATDIDIRDTHFTFGCVALRRVYVSDGATSFEGILHADKDWVLGRFDRLKYIAIVCATELKHPVVCYLQSSGGSSSGYEIPAGTKWEDWTTWFNRDSKETV